MIKNYHPAPNKIRDNRNSGIGYYTAVCDSCGTEFYPKRSSAKYCTPKCAVNSHRKAKASGIDRKVSKATPKPTKVIVSTDNVTLKLRGISNVYSFLKEHVPAIRGKKQEIINSLSSLPLGEVYVFDDFSIKKLSILVFELS